ncbi:MAG TPA: vWA domain-containing protein [Gaiellaceae bacterium]|nr:vWA domain-containing protein [Gaiellaceae bacterium]
MTSQRILRLEAGSREAGQAVVLIVLFLAVLLGMAAMVVDVGYAYYAHRSLQASADAAALAGAQALPDARAAEELALDYSGAPGHRNAHPNIANVTATVTTKCVQSIPGCDPVNSVVVVQRARTRTLFAGVLGIREFNFRVRATACSPCGVKPVDMMLVLDRTGSMCQDHWGNYDPACTDLRNAREGMKTFLGFFDGSTQWIGLAVLPPATSVGNRCVKPDTNNYNSRSAAYTIVSLSSDYVRNGRLNENSDLVRTIECQKADGRTAYANALEAAQQELDRNGRPDVKDVIVFLSDGAANIGPTYYSTSSPYRRQPCHQGVWSADDIKDGDTLIYSIGYDLDALNGGANRCTSYTGADEQPSITAYQALEQIASSEDTFYNQPNPGELRTIFTKIAADLAQGSSALIDDELR